MIGLKRGTVKLLPYNKKWHTAFEKEKKTLKKKLGKAVVDIQHIGSTAVPGLHAKPIIDMSAGIKKFEDVKKFVKPLREIGYGFYRKFQRQVLFAKGPDEKRTHYLHVMKYNGAKWKSDLAFRDYLLRHPARVRAYTVLKKRLAKKYPNDREKYTAGKISLLKRLLDWENQKSRRASKEG